MREGLASIQFLRFVAATLVTFFHATEAIHRYSAAVPDEFRYVAKFGASGVHIFFVISGFIMVYTSFSKERDVFSPKQFLLRRFLRIFPTYWLYAGAYLLLHNLALNGYALSSQEVLGSLLLLPGYSSLIIGPGWSLSYEVYFYICFAAVMICGLRQGLLIMTAFFLICIAGRFALDTEHPMIHVATNPLLIEFLMGAWIAFLFTSSVKIGAKLANVMLIVGLATFLAGLAIGRFHFAPVLMWAVPSALLVAGLVFAERHRGLSSPVRTCAFLGDSSYSLYLLHIALIDITLATAAHFDLLPKSLIAIIAACSFLTIVCVAIAFWAYELIERRLVASLQSLSKSRPGKLSGNKQTG